MGNHAVGQAIGFAAEAAVKLRSDGETALDILDHICAPYRNCDAEFESTNPANAREVHPEYAQVTDPHPKAALGMLMLEAFAPNGVQDLARYRPMLSFSDEAAEVACDAWEAEVGKPFSARYSFY